MGSHTKSPANTKNISLEHLFFTLAINYPVFYWGGGTLCVISDIWSSLTSPYMGVNKWLLIERAKGLIRLSLCEAL